MSTSRGSLIERLFQIGALECTICHDGETLQFYQSDLEEIKEALKIVTAEKENASDLECKLEDISFQIQKRKEIIKATVEQRRRLMSTLENLNSRDWCSCKHYSEVVSRALEIYCTTWSDEDYSHLIQTYKIWAMRLSLYFGIQYTTCFRCLSDKLVEKRSS